MLGSCLEGLPVEKSIVRRPAAVDNDRRRALATREGWRKNRLPSLNGASFTVPALVEEVTPSPLPLASLAFFVRNGEL